MGTLFPMNDYNLPIDYVLFERVYGPVMTNLFKSLGITHYLDTNAFFESKGYQPDVASIWLFGQGGSYDFVHPTHGCIDILNGTMLRVNGERIPFGEEYYRLVTGRPLVTQRVYSFKL